MLRHCERQLITFIVNNLANIEHDETRNIVRDNLPTMPRNGPNNHMIENWRVASEHAGVKA